MARTHVTPDRHDEATETDRPAFRVHWMITAPLLGLASWAVIAAVVAAALGSWPLTGLLLLTAVALVGTLVLLARGGTHGVQQARRARRGHGAGAAGESPDVRAGRHVA